MKAFHITRKDYEEGRTYSIYNYDGQSYYHRSLNLEQKNINDTIDNCRPDNEPSRKKCFFAFENIENCLGFVKSFDEYKLYQIDINSTNPHPMYLIDFLNNNLNLISSLAHVYWDQSLLKDFQIKEFIGSEIRIISQLELPQNNIRYRQMMITKYNHDKDVCKSLCRRMGIRIQ